MHGFRFLCEVALSPVRQYGEKTDSDVVRIAQLERINEGEPLGEWCCIYQSYFNEENLSDIAFGCGSDHCRVAFEVKTPLLVSLLT
jgi:hypothetical protein